MKNAIKSSFGMPDDQAIISKAVIRAGEILGLKQLEMADILGKSESSISRIANRSLVLDPSAKESEIATIFLRMYRSLDALFGGRETDIRQWLVAENYALGGTPRHLIKTLQGLFHVTEYLDAMRAKV